MKKLVALLLVVVIMAATLCACSSFKCDLCGEEKYGEKHTVELFGAEVTYCSDCEDALDDLGNMFR